MLITKAITVVTSKWTAQTKRGFMQIHLGWSLPTNNRLSLEPFLKALKEVCGDNLHTHIGTTVCVKLAHDCTGPPDNQCASHWLQNMPFQGDNFNVCGVAE